jgi:hypothetical protein
MIYDAQQRTFWLGSSPTVSRAAVLLFRFILSTLSNGFVPATNISNKNEKGCHESSSRNRVMAFRFQACTGRDYHVLKSPG